MLQYVAWKYEFREEPESAVIQAVRDQWDPYRATAMR